MQTLILSDEELNFLFTLFHRQRIKSGFHPENSIAQAVRMKLNQAMTEVLEEVAKA